MRLQYERPMPLVFTGGVVYSRDGGQNFPEPQLYTLRRSASTLSVVNNTFGSLAVQVSGQVGVSVAQGATGTIQLSPGSNVVSVSGSCGSTSTTLTVSQGESYRTTYFCREVSQAAPSAPARVETGRLTVRNQTGSPLTMDVSGPTSGRYTFQVGDSSIELPLGGYSIEVSSACGRRSDSVTIERRGTAIETYFCQQR